VTKTSAGKTPFARAWRVLALMILSVLPWASAHADEFSDWQKFRATKYAELVAARPDQDGQIALVKAETAAMIAAYGPPTGRTLDQPSVVWRTSATPLVVFDAPYAPRTIVVPAGEFTMGSPKDEPGRRPTEGPRHRVRIAQAFAVSMFPIVYGEYAWFVSETHHRSGGACITDEEGVLKARAARDWREPGFAHVLQSPVTCIDFNDASAYVAWLSKKTGQTYRLLSEAEYEYISRAGATTAYPWGDEVVAACRFVNGFDLDAQPYEHSAAPIDCHDGSPFTSRVDKFKAGAFGLFDTTGNVASWTADCWKSGYVGAAMDGAPSTGGDCAHHALRGGSWLDVDLRSASRRKAPVGYVASNVGFRVVRVLK
jgi:formylglycine-generating enzyme required for sulfatase activity